MNDNLKTAGAIGLFILGAGMALSFVPTSSETGNLRAVAILGGAVGYFLTDYFTTTAWWGLPFVPRNPLSYILGILIGMFIAVGLWNITQKKLAVA